MYNSETSRRSDLPSSGRLVVSTISAAIVALAVLVTVVLPAEYGIDPTRVGNLLGLTQMGEIKMQLAREAAADQQATAQQSQSAKVVTGTPSTSDGGQDARIAAIEKKLELVITMLESQQLVQKQESAKRQDLAVKTDAQEEPAATEQPQVVQPKWRDEVSFVLKPGQGIEFKLVMSEGAEAEFEWTANGSVLNYDTHGDGGGRSVSYEKGRGVPGQSGVLTAAFEGNHGWFWRNRTDESVTLTLRTRGAYSELKRTA